MLVFVGFELIALGLFVALTQWDRKTIGHIHPATRLGFTVAVLTSIVRLAFLFTGAWAPIAAHLPGV